MEKKFQYKGLDIHYTIVGKGTPVVLLHGFGENSKIWNKQLPLQEFCQLIIPDLPGSGNSDLLQGENITMEDYADCLKALIDIEKIEKCILLGHSMGGYITLVFAKKYPVHLLGYGLVHSTAFADSEEKKITRSKGIQLIQEYGVYPFLKNTTPNLFSERYKKEHLDKMMELIEAGKQFTTDALIQYYTAMKNRNDNTQVLKEASIPVLFIIGTDDTAAPLTDLLKQVHLPKISVVHILKNVGHMSMMEEPKLLNDHILTFINNTIVAE